MKNNKKEKLQKKFINIKKSNDNIIKDYNEKISLFEMCSKKYRNFLSVIYSLGFSIGFAVIFHLSGNTIIDMYTPIICLGTSVTLGSVLTIIKTKKYKKILDKIPLEIESKEKMSIDETMVRYYISKDKMIDNNEIIKKINDNFINKKESYFISNEIEYMNKEELLKSISRQKESIDIKEEKLDIVSSKKSLNSNLGYNKIYSYLKTTVFSLFGVFSICYLPSIGTISNDMILECIKISLLFNIPINIVNIKNLIEDKKIYKKINEEINQKNNKYQLLLNDEKLDILFKKLINELYVSEIQLASDELELSSREESDISYYRDNLSLHCEKNTKEYNKILFLQKSFRK